MKAHEFHYKYYCTWPSYGKNAMLISFRVLIFLAAHDLQISLKSSSPHTAIITQVIEF